MARGAASSTLFPYTTLFRSRSAGAAEAFEVAAGGELALPQGKEADGIRGDFVLRNDKAVALVSQNAPLRRANMSTFYGAEGRSEEHTSELQSHSERVCRLRL